MSVGKIASVGILALLSVLVMVIAPRTAGGKNARCAARPSTPVTPAALPPARDNAALRFHFLDVGAGLCVLVECPRSNEALVVDCGSAAGPQAMSTDQVFAYLDHHLAGKTYSVVVSHADRDHYTMLRPYASRDEGVPDGGGGTRAAHRVLFGGDRSDYTCRSGTRDLFSGWPGSVAPPTQPGASAARKRRLDDDDAMPGVTTSTYDDDQDGDDEDDNDVSEDDEDDDGSDDDSTPVPPPAKRSRAVDDRTHGFAQGTTSNPDDTVRGRDLGPGLFAIMDEFGPNGELAGGPRLMPRFACGAATVYVLTAPQLPARKTNPRSVILAVKYGDFEAILPGDSEGTTESAARVNSTNVRQLGNDSVSPPIELFAAAHHGADTHRSNSSDWIRDVGPRAAIFSSGAAHVANGQAPKMYYGHPRTPVVDTFIRNGTGDLTPECKHAFVQCANGCALASDRTEAVFSTAASGTLVVDARPDGAFEVRAIRAALPAWLSTLTGQPASCSIPLPPPPSADTTQ